MNLEEKLLEEHSKTQALSIASYIGNDKERFDQLMEFFLGKDTRVHQRAAMAMSICVDRHPNLILPYLPSLIENLNNPVHDGIIRNTFRVLQDIELPEELWGDAWELGYKYLESPKYAVAIRVFAMTVLANICTKVPELKNELRILIEDQMPYGSAGFISRGKKVLCMLKKH